MRDLPLYSTEYRCPERARADSSSNRGKQRHVHIGSIHLSIPGSSELLAWPPVLEFSAGVHGGRVRCFLALPLQSPFSSLKLSQKNLSVFIRAGTPAFQLTKRT